MPVKQNNRASGIVKSYGKQAEDNTGAYGEMPQGFEVLIAEMARSFIEAQEKIAGKGKEPKESDNAQVLKLLNKISSQYKQSVINFTGYREQLAGRTRANRFCREWKNAANGKCGKMPGGCGRSGSPAAFGCQYELSVEIETSLQKLKQVIQVINESEKIAAKISKMVNNESDNSRN